MAPSGGLSACGTSGGNGVSAPTLRRTRTAPSGLKRCTSSFATLAFICRSTAIVVEHEDPAPVRADDEVVAFDRDVAERRRRQIEHQRLPRVAVVERHVHGALGTEEQQAGALRVFAQDARVAAVGLVRWRGPW